MKHFGGILRFPILRSILLSQVAVVVLGLGTLYLAMYLVGKANTEMAIEKKRQNLIFNLDPYQEKWRSWSMLGMNDSLSEEMSSFAKRHQLESLEMVPYDELPKELAGLEVVVPEKRDGLTDKVIHARINGDGISAIYATNQLLKYLLLALAVVFISFTILFTFFIRRKIYNPIFDLNKAFGKLNQGNQLNIKDIAASGEMRDFLRNIQNLYNDKCENDRLSAIGEITSQVAHDIRSPLVALAVATRNIDSLPEETRLLLRSAVQRIDDIASNLKSTQRNSEENQSSVQLVSGLISSIVSEKRVQYKNSGVSLNWDLSKQEYGIFTRVNSTAFKRSLSNILNNSFESMEPISENKVNEITISLKSIGSRLLISVVDTGCGIPTELVGQITRKGVSFRKEEGTGLGLSYAKEQVEKWGGELKITSSESSGTQVDILMEKCEPPGWFNSEIKVSPETKLFVLDDDPSIHQVWGDRFERIGMKIESFANGESFIQAFKKMEPTLEDWLILCDYQILTEEKNGFEIITELKQESHSVIVSSLAEDPSLQSQCESRGIKLLPKSFASLIPMTVSASHSS